MAKTLRLKCDCMNLRPGALIDQESGEYPVMVAGDDAIIDVAFFSNGRIAKDDVQNFKRALLYFKDFTGETPPDADDLNYALKTVEEIDASLTEASWASGSKHLSFTLDSVDTNVSFGWKWLAIVLETDSTRTTYAFGRCLLVSSGAQNQELTQPELENLKDQILELSLEIEADIEGANASFLQIEQAAQAAKDSAEASASSALNSKNASESSASSALEAATNAANSANSAREKALDAQNSALAAQASKDAAASSAQNAQTNQELATSAANSASASASAAESAKTSCAQSQSSCETSASQALQSKAEAVQARDEAVQAAEEAKAISDPDGLLQKHEAELSALQSGKVNIGEHLFKPSSYAMVSSSGLLGTDVFSICFLTDFDFQPVQSSNVWYPFNLGVLTGTEGDINSRIYAAVGNGDYFRLYPGASYANSFRMSDIRPYATQALNAVCFVIYSNKAPKLFINGVEIIASVQRSPEAWTTDNSNFYLNAALNTSGYQTTVDVSYRNVLAVNFDMSAEDAPYSIADFAEGKSVPLTLRKEAGIYSTDPDMGASTGAGWAINAPSGSSITTRGDWRCFSAVYYAYNRTADLPDGVSYAVDLSTKPKSSSTGDAYLANMGLGNLAGFSGKTVKGKLSFWYKKNNTDSSSYLGAMISKSVLGEITSAEVSDTDWHYFEADVETELTGTSGFYLGVYSYAASGTFTDYPWSIADFKFETYGEKLELADFRSGYQIKDLSGNGNHATIFGEVLSRKNENPTTMQVDYTWGSGVSTGAYIMGDTVTLPANSEIEVLAKASASATLSLGTSSSASTTFANAKTVGTTTASIAKFYTTSTAQKLFATPSVAGLTINLTLKITSLK